MDTTLEKVLRAWEVSGPLHEPRPGVTSNELDQAEAALGRGLPAAFRQLYFAFDGGSFLHGNLVLEPLLAASGDSEARAVTTGSELLRGRSWPIPPELVVIGGNGGDEHFGIWLPAGGEEVRPLLVQVGEVFEEESFAIVGDDLASFLLGWSAFYLLLNGDVIDVGPALDALGLPAQLRVQSTDLGDDAMDAILNWASPNLPDPRPDPYERGLTAGQVGEIARRQR